MYTRKNKKITFIEAINESIHLEKLKNIIEEQKTPADVLIDEYNLSKDIINILNKPYY